MLLDIRKIWLRLMPSSIVVMTTIVFCLLSNNIKAQDYYWVNGTGSWGDISHWSLTSGGPSNVTQLPNTTTSVIFDENSFTSTTDTIYINNQNVLEEYCLCNDLIFKSSATTMTPTVAGMTPLQIHGTMQLMEFEDLHWLFQGIIEFRSNEIETITAHQTFFNGSMTFIGTGEWTLQDDIYVDANIFLQSGTLNTNNKTVSCDKFFSNSEAVRSLNAGQSSFYINKGGDNFVWVVENSDLFNLNSGTSTINFTHSHRSRMLAGDNLNYYDILFTSKSISGDIVATGCSFDDIEFRTSGNIYGSGNIALTTSCGGDFKLNGNQNRFETNITVAGNVDVLNGSNYFNNFYLSRFLLGNANVMTLQPNETQTFDGEGLVLTGEHSCTKLSIMADSSISYPPPGHAIIYSDTPLHLSLTALSYIHAKNSLDPTGSGVVPDTASLSSNDNSINWDFSDRIINIDSTLIKNVHPCAYSVNGELTLYVSDLRHETQYSIDGINWVNTPFFQNLPSGPVTVQFRQKFNGSFCIMDFTYTTTIGAPPQIEINNIQKTDVLCNNACDATITIMATVDNTLPSDTLAIEYSINWGSGNTFQSSNTFENLCAGTYQIMVRDENGCYYGYDEFGNFIPETIEILQPEIVTAIATTKMVSCNGMSDGEISILPSGGVAPYQHSWSNGESGFEITNLLPGTYSDTIRDQNGCTIIVTKEITEPDALAIIFQQGAVTGPPVSYWAEATVSGGTPPYTHHWNEEVINFGNSINSNPIINLISGAYIDSVRDANGCYVIDTVFLDSLSVATISGDVECFGDNSGWAEALVHGGNTPYTYSWYSLPDDTFLGNSTTINNLPAGSYYVIVSDITLSEVRDTVTILQPSAPISANAIIDSISCNNQTDGAIQLNPLGGTPFISAAENYQYAWFKNGVNMGISSSSISELETATYSVEITDSLGCIFDTTIILSNPEPLSLTHSIGNDDCTIDGFWIEVTVSGSTAPYQYFWDDLGQTTNIITNLTSGDFPVTITDYHGCVLQDTFNIIGFESSITSGNVSCFDGDDGWAKVTIVGNSPPYSYSWFPKPVLGEDRDSIYQIGAGKYVVHITDASSCVFKDSIEISQPEIITYNNVNIQNVTGCFGDSNGSIELDVSGGTPNYQYSIDDGTNWQSSSTFQNLVAGNYSLKVRDANLCEISYFANPVIITEPEKLSFQTIATENPLCSYSADGTINITSSGGTGLTSFSIDNGVSWSNNGLFTNLPEGGYFLKIKDENGCLTSLANNPINLVAPSQLGINFNTTNPTCNGCSDGEATANPYGGTPPYQHNWSNGSTTANASNLSAGVWYIDSIFDAHNCLVVDSIILFEPQSLNMVLFSENVTCYGESTGSASIIPSGGTRPYSIEWSKKPSPTTISNDTLIENIDTGIYYVLVTDNFGHSIIDSVFISQPEILSIDFELSVDTICPEDSTAWIVAHIEGGTAPYFYFWSDGSSFVTRPDSIFALHSGSYQLEVLDINGCSIEKSITIEAYTPPLAAFTAEDVCLGNITSFYGDATITNSTPETWFINFGDGESATSSDNGSLPFATHLYQSAGIYQVELFLIDSHGCLSDTIIQEIEVKAIPNAAFLSDTACFGNSTHFFDNSQSNIGNIEDWEWRFPNGNSTSQNPNYIFEEIGFQNVTLTVSNSIGCYDSITVPVLIDSLPIPNFDFENVCFGTLQFSDLSQNNGSTIEQWNWNLGDGFSASIQNPAHTYINGNQSYDIQLLVTNDRKCSDSITKPVMIPSWVDAEFIWDTVCVGMETSFSGIIFSGEDVIQSMNWTFGDGAIGVGQNVEHIYFQPGTYIVSLDILDTLGCSMTIYHDVVVSPPHTTEFTYSTACQNETIEFSGISSSANITEWLWDFGDGSSSNEQNPQHSYLYSGNYLVNLSTWDNNGCFSQKTEAILVSISPNALFSYENDCETKSIFFANQSIPGYGEISGSFWDFGDGTTSTETNPTHLYNLSGNFEVTLTVTNSNGCASTIITPIVVNSDLIAEFTCDSVCNQQTVSFEDISTSLGGGVIVSRKWLFGDGTQIENLENVSHIYPTYGLYEAQLIIKNSFGCIDTTTNIVEVFAPPSISFIYETDTLCLGDTAFFENQNSTISGDIISWDWNFGDPNSGTYNTSSLQNPYHLYTIPGVYNITLTITDDKGCSSQYQKTIVINNLPTAHFQISETACSGDTTWFTDFSSSQVGNVVEWYWDFGNDENSSLQNPYHIFSGGVGDTTYTVNLTIWDDFGCSNTISQTVTIFGLPNSDFIIEDNCFQQNTIFTDQSSTSSGTISSWEWSFGDGNFSAQQNPIYLYNSTGDFTVQLISTTSNGCSDTSSQQHTIFHLPEPNFSTDTVCFSDTTYLFDETVSSSDIINWSWNFGDPESGESNYSSLQNPGHKFSNWGEFQVKLVVTNSNNCSDSITLPVYIRPLPIADFTVENSSCMGVEILFTDATNFNLGEPYKWTWNFGDGYEETIFAPQNPNISHIYENSGFFNAILTVENIYGCIDSAFQTVEVFTPPQAGFIWNDSSCTPGYIQFTDTSTAVANNIASREWYPEYPNPLFLSGEEPTYIYGVTDTTYIMMLIVTTEDGCRDTILDSIYIREPFTVDFTASEACEGFATSFLSEIVTPIGDSIISYSWNFGDNTTSSLPNPEHIYEIGGQYNVWLQATNIYGCLSQVSKTINVKDKPNAAFTVLPEGCSNLSYFEDNTLFNGAEPFHWYYNFGDGTDTNLWAANGSGSLFHEYPNYAENWQVMLVVENSFGCSDTVFGVAERFECLTADFVQINSTCGKRPTFFENSSTVYGDDTEVTQTIWHYGDGTFESFNYFSDTVSHIYEFAGTYNLNLVVVAESNGTVIQDSITKIIEVKSTPHAEFSFGLGCEGSAVEFSNNSDPVNSSILSSQWFFGDGYSSATHSPNHIFSEDGEYETTLIVVSMEGCTDTISHQVKVHPKAEVFLDVDKDVGCSGYASFFLKDTTSQEKAYYRWGLGSEQFVTTSEDTISTYLHTGDYTLSLEVETEMGCKAFDTASVSVFESPEALFTHFPDSASISDSIITFFDNSVSLDGSIEQYFWKFDDYGTTFGDQVEWKFPDTGWYKVTEYITTEHGCSDSVSKMVRVYPQFYCWIPNAFTPNGDGRNDEFFPVLTFSAPQSYNFQIFDKWGSIIYNSNTVGDSWNGKNSNGKRCPAGSYAYLILVTDPYNQQHVYKGSFTLMR